MSRPAAGDIRGCWTVFLVAWMARSRQVLVAVGGWCHRPSSPDLKASPLALSGSLLPAGSSSLLISCGEGWGMVGFVWCRWKPLVGLFDHDGGDTPRAPLSSLEAPSRSLLPTPISSSRGKPKILGLGGSGANGVVFPLRGAAWGCCSMGECSPWRVGGW
jgi:hypothetical protein